MSVDITSSLPDEVQVLNDKVGFLIVAGETGNYLFVETGGNSVVDVRASEAGQINVASQGASTVEVTSCNASYQAIIDYLDISARHSSNDLLVYGGRAEVDNPLPTDSVWQIYVLNIDTLEKLYADGNQNYDNNWANRESLSYS